MKGIYFYIRWIKKWTAIRDSTSNQEVIKRANKHIKTMTHNVKEYQKILFYMKGRCS